MDQPPRTKLLVRAELSILLLPKRNDLGTGNGDFRRLRSSAEAGRSWWEMEMGAVPGIFEALDRLTPVGWIQIMSNFVCDLLGF
jgi:hypothetical protein